MESCLLSEELDTIEVGEFSLILWIKSNAIEYFIFTDMLTTTTLRKLVSDTACIKLLQAVP